jgi:hypothetical protein
MVSITSFSSFAMADLDLSATYVFKNELLGSSNALASTPENSSVIVEPVNESDSQLWFATETNLQGYYRLHTVGKGNYSALDVYNYIGSQTLDLHFYADQDLTGQYWRLDIQEGGSMKISNNFTGPDIYLNIADGTQKPTLAAGDSSGSRWTLSSLGSDPTPTSTTSVTSTETGSLTASTASGTASSSNGPSDTATSNSNDPDSPSGSNKPSTGAIAGIAVSSVVGAALLGVLIYFLIRRCRRPQVNKQDDDSLEMQPAGAGAPRPMGTMHVLHGP